MYNQERNKNGEFTPLGRTTRCLPPVSETLLINVVVSLREMSLWKLKDKDGVPNMWERKEILSQLGSEESWL